MITCPKCNRELNDEAKFCDGCGTQFFETIFCPHCGNKTSTEFTYCQSCGAAINEEQPVVIPPEKKSFPKKALVFAGIGIAVIVVLILAISLFSGGKSKTDFALYLKDNEIVFSDLKKDGKAWELTSRLVDTEDVDNEELSYAADDLGMYTFVSENGKYIFFPDKVSNNGLGIYYKELAKPEADAIKVDSDIEFYTVNTASTLVTYLKGDECDLYQYSLSTDTKDKIGSEVEYFKVSDDGAKIFYSNSDGDLYLKDGKKDKEKIASEVYSVEYLSDDFQTVYYKKDDSLYKQTVGEDRIKIASEVYRVIQIYETGELYYLTYRNNDTPLMNYVNDDKKAEDAALIEPNYPSFPEAPDYPYWSDYETDAEYDAAYAAYEAWEEECERIENEYYAEMQAYWAKEKRDELRESLKEETLDLSGYPLCFYNGIDTTVITDELVGEYYFDYTYADNEPVIAYEAYNPSAIKRVKLSEVDSLYDLEESVESAMRTSTERYIAVKDVATPVEQEKEARDFEINSDGTVVYYIDDIPDDKNYGSLYRISIADGIVGKAEVYDTDVYTGNCYFVTDDTFAYYKDYKSDSAELYVNKTRIDYDVNPYNTVMYNDADTILYFTDWNYSKENGTLKLYQNGKAVKIADDVHAFYDLNDGCILYLYDYSMNYYKGELHVWKNGENRKVDDDVVAIVPIHDADYRSMLFEYNY